MTETGLYDVWEHVIKFSQLWQPRNPQNNTYNPPKVKFRIFCAVLMTFETKFINVHKYQSRSKILNMGPRGPPGVPGCSSPSLKNLNS